MEIPAEFLLGPKSPSFHLFRGEDVFSAIEVRLPL